MIGHLKPTFCSSSPDSKENYWEFYCSVCASLRKNHGTSYSLLLNNELTLILSAFQEDYATLVDIKTPCPASAFVLRRFAFTNEAIDTAGHLSVVLGWIKALDWYSDKPNPFKKLLLNRLEKRAKKVLPALTPESQALIAEYARITRENEQNFRVIRQQSNALARMLVQEVGKHTEADRETIELLSDLFGKAGELVAVADHLIDLDKDLQYNQYNPIALHSEQKQTPLAQAYINLKMEYYALRGATLALLPRTNPAFAEAFRRSLHRLDKQIDKNLPACMQTEEGKLFIGKMQTVQASFVGLPPSMTPPPSGCCDEACAGACLGACCQLCAQGCCDDLCDICCSEKCCEGCCSGSGSSSGGTTSAERQQRREQRRAEREARKQARRDAKLKGKEKPKEKDKDKDDDVYD